MAPSDEVEVWLIRHGETEWSRNGRHTGLTDLPLTPHGEEAAKALAPRLVDVAFGRVLSSPLLRARHTAAGAGFPNPVVTGDLIEWNYGDYEGRTTMDIHRERPDWFIWRDGCPGGESPEQVVSRVQRVIDRSRADGGRTLLFAHSHVLRTLAATWVGGPTQLGAHLPLSTATVSVLGFDRGIPTIQRWNAGL